MIALLVVAAFVTVVGALVAVTARDARIALVGLVASLIGGSRSWPTHRPGSPPSGCGPSRHSSAATCSASSSAERRGSPAASLVGLPAEALAAAAAFVIGFGSDGLASTPVGPPLALGAGLALIALAIAPVARATTSYGSGSRSDGPDHRRRARPGRTGRDPRARWSSC